MILSQWLVRQLALSLSRTGAITTDVNHFIHTYEPGYKSRNYDVNNHNLIIKHKQDYFRNSFFIRTAELWNSLPSHVKSSDSLHSFKGYLYQLFSKVDALRSSGFSVKYYSYIYTMRLWFPHQNLSGTVTIHLFISNIFHCYIYYLIHTFDSQVAMCRRTL